MGWFDRKPPKETDETALQSQVDQLTEERRGLLTEIGDLQKKAKEAQLDRKIAEQEMEHLVRIKQEKDAVEMERKLMEVERQKAAEIQAIRDDYAQKIEDHLNDQVKRLESMYGEVLERLPNISAKLSGSLTGQ